MQATHCRDQTVESASPVNSGVGLWLSAAVSIELNIKYNLWKWYDFVLLRSMLGCA